MQHLHQVNMKSDKNKRRFLTRAELDKLWTWVCGTTLGGGFIRGTSTSIAKALGIQTRTFERLMEGKSNFSINTIDMAISIIDNISKKEELSGDSLSRLAWDAESNTAQDENGRYFARYQKNGSWSYLIGCGSGYRYLACARHAADKMRALQAARK